jgi:hypothetical protein
LADDSVPVPRCSTCKLSDWERAEKDEAVPPTPPDDDSTAGAANSSDWSPGLRSQVVHTCTSSWRGSLALCGCVVSYVAQQIPGSEAQSLSPDDKGLLAAASACNPAGQVP